MRKTAGVAIGALYAAVSVGVLLYPVNVRAGQDTGSYTRVDNWAHLPPGTQWGVMSAVDVDSKGNVYAFQRSEPTSKVIVLDGHGKYLRAWGEDVFPSAHGLSVAPDDSIWTTDRKTQQAQKFDTNGKLLLSLGQKDVAGDISSEDAFNGVSGVAIGANGDIFVSDGEGPNSRVVKFSKNGTFIKFWGTKGSGEGELNVPHAIAIDSKGRVWVCDRSNKRLEVFDQDGKYLDQMTQFGTPSAIAFGKGDLMYIADGAPENQIVIGTADGKVLETIHGLKYPHGIAVDASGDIYVAETEGKTISKYVKK